MPPLHVLHALNPPQKISRISSFVIELSNQPNSFNTERTPTSIKFYPFATMDSSLMARFQNLSHHLIAQSKFQNPNYSNGPAYAGHLFSLGWRKAYESKTTVGITGIAEKVSRSQRLGRSPNPST
ncbi:hypothetical protein PCASD_25198 [Puccinia coronata f. sp. avenae]|uniref:Tet-like 2OG-Fe(II) oxygenase domain-containing protein n=1 Tax=Puccinia coronata f. sp. avenae TaxID=200324 RepID=A0A2N5S8B5_9BASI|nr:hypothetical protein PCASD_25198 [Puccinia coronata f. sp. avenae]